MKTRCNKENRFSSGSPCCYSSEQSVLLSGYYFFIFPLPLPFVKLLPSNFCINLLPTHPCTFHSSSEAFFRQPSSFIKQAASAYSLIKTSCSFCSSLRISSQRFLLEAKRPPAVFSRATPLFYHSMKRNVGYRRTGFRRATAHSFRRL